MTRSTLIALAFAAAACGQTITLSQNFDPVTIVPGGSVSCAFAGSHHDSAYYRTFNLVTQGVFSDIRVFSLTFGVESTSGGEDSQAVRVLLFLDPSPQPGVIPPAGVWATPSPGLPPEAPKSPSLVCLADEETEIQNGIGPLLFTYTFCTPVRVPVTTGAENLIACVATPAGAATAGALLIPGANAAGESNPSFMSAAQCNVTTPTPLSSIGSPMVHLILSLDAVPQGFAVPGGNPLGGGTCGDLSLTVTLNGAASAGPFHAAVIGDLVEARALSATGAAVGFPVQLLLGLYPTGTPPSPLTLPLPFTGSVIGGASTVWPPPVPGIGPVLLSPFGFRLAFVFPFGAGTSIVMQAMSLYTGAANGFFDTSAGAGMP